MSIKSIQKTLNTLDFFLNNKSISGISLKDLCFELGFKKSAAHHMLSTICNNGYLYKDARTKKYFLSSKIKKFAEVINLNNQSLIDYCLPFLKKINNETGETVHLSSFEGNKLITLKILESIHPVRVDNGFLNKDNAFHATASGKAILAFLNFNQQNQILNKNFFRFTKKTIVNRDLLFNELNNIKKKGYAIDDEEFQEGVFCIGFPIIDENNLPIASISCSSPKYKITNDKKYLLKIINSTKNSILEINKYFQKKINKPTKGDKKYAA
jgi:IclR family acetate operon transcriptional repressor